MISKEMKVCLMSIAVDDAVKIYKNGKETIALRGTSLSVEAGEFITVVGPSGSGKSTLLHLIGGMDKPDAGTIEVCDHQLNKLSNKELSRYRLETIGFVFQFNNLVPFLNALENIMLPMAFKGIQGKIRKERACSLLDSVGLLDKEFNKPYQLSGGEKQRVAVAVALANDPPVILADEPTGELDSESGQLVCDLFKQLQEESGKTFIIVTHDSKVASIGDKQFNMKDGLLKLESQQS